MALPPSVSTLLIWRFNCVYDPRADGAFVSPMRVGRVQHLRLPTCLLPIVTWGTRMVAMPPPPPPVAPASLEDPFHWLCGLCVPDPHSPP